MEAKASSMADYKGNWDIPLFAGREKVRSEMVAGQLHAINKVADEYDIQKQHDDILLDVYGEETAPVTVDKVVDVDFNNYSVARADLEYGEDQPHIGATYTRDSLVGQSFHMEVDGSRELREELEQEVGESLHATGWKRLWDMTENLKTKLEGDIQ